MNKKQRKLLVRILLSLALLIILTFLKVEGYWGFALHLIPYLIAGYDILRKAGRGIVNGQIMDENFLMAVATIGAMIIGLVGGGDYVEAIAVMLFYQVGELFQSYAVGKSRKNIAKLMDIRPDYANIEEDGKLRQCDPEEVPVGTVIVVRPGEKIPMDGVVVQGHSSLDTGALTGESLPRDVKERDEVISGCVNMTGVLYIRTTKEFGESTVSKILELVENASSRKSRSEEFISRFARIYTPVVCISALILAVLPPLAQSLLWQNYGTWAQWLYRALSFLVASCPCALVISIPLSFFGGIGGASRAGVLVKGSNYLEALSKTSCLVFDKTGTLTQGKFRVTKVLHNSLPRETLLEYAALAESASSHPIALGLLASWGKEPDRRRVSAVQEKAGSGVIAQVDGKTVAVGSQRLMESLGIAYPQGDAVGAAVHVAIEGQYAGQILLADALKMSAAQAVGQLKKAGIRKLVMLTGDTQPAARQAAEELGISEFYSQLLPADKVTKVEELLAAMPKGKKLAFVGDGINDAPVLSRADIGIAMGAMGSDAAIEAADIVLMDDDPLKISKAIRISRKCLGIVYQNIVFSIAVKILALILVAFGMGNMWLAIFADVGVMILSVLNAIRALFVKKL